ncbi:Spindle assembly abnormal protein 6 [Perkinsus olseni]|uniref:Spindle assembly abnormal protein 6 n=1 Tax=Perkinsus olseni TaxID=32597 RepID=A0A7J6P161_PEROL|nr:Spindle assembly abnormal protein 6 [Perkinsus olseni]
MQTHEETIHELDHRLLEEQRSHDDSKLEHKRTLDALDRAQEDCEATRGKLAEAHKLLESNEQVISYLNKRLTDRDVKVLSGVEPSSSSSASGYSALSLPILPSHRQHPTQASALGAAAASTSHHHSGTSSSRSHSPSTSRPAGGGVLANRTNVFEGSSGAMQLANVGRQPAPPYQSGQRLASGFTIPGGPSAKRPNLEEISAIGHHQGAGMENQPPPSSATITPSSSALQSRLAAGPPPDVESLTSRLSLPEIHFDLTKGFPRVPHKLSLKEKAVKIVGALMTTPPVHLSLLLGQMLACLLSAVYAVSQLIVVGSPRVPSYFQLSRESLADTLEGYFQSTWSGVL